MDVTRSSRLHRAATWAGPAGIAVGFLAVLASVALASFGTGSWFTWTGNALSDLGHPSRATSPVFNGGLVLAGLLGAAFALRLWPTASNHAHRAGVVLFALSQVDLSLIGVFDVTSPLHFTVSVLYFSLFTYALFAYGSGDALAGRARRGVLAVWLGVANATAWVAWSAVPYEGVAIPEFLGSVLLAVWVVAMVRTMESAPGGEGGVAGATAAEG